MDQSGNVKTEDGDMAKKRNETERPVGKGKSPIPFGGITGGTERPYQEKPRQSSVTVMEGVRGRRCGNNRNNREDGGKTRRKS